MENSDIHSDDTCHVEIIHEFRYYLDSELSASLSDHDCLRFLRAKEGDVQKSVDMVKAWNEWRHSLQASINSEILKYSANIILSCQASDLLWNHPHSHLLPCRHHGFDKAGRPVFWIQLGFIISEFKEIRKYFTNDQLIHYIVWNQEAMLLRQEYSSRNRLRRVAQSVIIADMSYLPMSSFMDKDALSLTRHLIYVSQRYYPETLHKLLMVNIPWHFSAAFKLFSPLIRPRTLGKICVARGKEESTSLLQKYLKESDIPPSYGGTCQVDMWDSSVPPLYTSGASSLQVEEFMAKKICPNIIDKVLWSEELAAWRKLQRHKVSQERQVVEGDAGRLRGDSVSAAQRHHREQKKRSFSSPTRGRRSGSRELRQPPEERDSLRDRDRTSEDTSWTGRGSVSSSTTSRLYPSGRSRELSVSRGRGRSSSQVRRRTRSQQQQQQQSQEVPLPPSVLSSVKTRIVDVEVYLIAIQIFPK